MSNRHLLFALFLLVSAGCSEPDPVTLEFRIAEDEPAPGLTQVTFVPTGERFYLHDEVLVDQTEVDSAVVIAHGGRPAVELALTSTGTRKFEELTTHHVGKRCGMVLDGQLVSVPRIMTPIRSGRVIIAGDFTDAEARRVVRGLTHP